MRERRELVISKVTENLVQLSISSVQLRDRRGQKNLHKSRLQESKHRGDYMMA